MGIIKEGDALTAAMLQLSLSARRESFPLLNPLNWTIRSAMAVAALLAVLTPPAFGAAPRVVKAVPDNGDTDVDPALKEIRIEFDQDMQPGGFSVCGGGPEFPEVTEQPTWKTKRIFIIPVRLEPDHAYSFSINCPSATNFRNDANEPAEIYPIAFQTAASDGKKVKPLTAKQNAAAIDKLRKAIDEGYSYRDVRKVDWAMQFKKYSTKLKKAKSPAEFARTAAKLLRPAKDMHIWLQVGKTPFATYQRRFRPNYRLDLLPEVVPQWNEHNDVVATGRFDDGAVYIFIKTWGLADTKQLEPAYAALASASADQGVIIDVRPNAGGAEPLALEFAGCFAMEPAVYSKSAYRTKRKKSGFARPVERTVEPNKSRPSCHGPVVVLTGKGVMSSCESFVLMMRHGAGATLVGDTTYGSSGNPKPHDLGNGVIVMLPSWKAMQPNGSLIEGKGIEPDVRIKIDKGDFKDSDPVLDAAREELRKRTSRK